MCLERNEHAMWDEDLEKYVFIKDCIQKLILDEKLTCHRCSLPGASIICRQCDKAYHGFECSEIYMTQNFRRELVCIECLYRNHPQEISEAKHEQLTAALWKRDLSIFKDYSREGFTHEGCHQKAKNSFTAQVGDEVYLLWQGYEQVLK